MKRRALLIEIPWVGLILGAGEIVMVLMVLHPNSSIAVRVLSGLQLLSAAGWVIYLFRAIYTSRRRPK